MNVRCSSLPLIQKCAQSMRGEVNINEYYPEADLGTAAHDAAARYVRGMPVDLSAIANLYGVDREELGMLAIGARKAWSELRPGGNGDVVLAEQHLSAQIGPDLRLTGTADVLVHHRIPAAVTIIDWKTGRRDADYRDQVLGYCALALDADPTVELAVAKLAWLRTLEVEAYSLTRDNLEGWKTRLAEQVADTAFRPGEHCKFCPRQFACPARADMQRSALALLGGEGARTLAELTAAQQLALYHRAKSVSQLATRVIGEIRDLVRAAPIEADGIKLSMVDEPRRTIHPREAWPVLQKYLSDDALAACVTISITNLEAAVAEGQPRGEGSSRRRALLAELEEAKAIGHTTQKKLMERRST